MKWDTTTSVLKSGFYFSAGVGLGGIEFDSYGYNISFSLTHKSHVFSSSVGHTFGIGGGSGKGDYSETSYVALLFGEALRKKHGFLSISSGISLSHLYFYCGSYCPETVDDGISIPVEAKVFVLAYKGLGIGLNVVTNFRPKYTPTIVTLALVFGIWNK